MSGLDMPFDQLYQSFASPPTIVDQESFSTAYKESIATPYEDSSTDFEPLGEDGENQLLFSNITSEDLEDLLYIMNPVSPSTSYSLPTVPSEGSFNIENSFFGEESSSLDRSLYSDQSLYIDQSLYVDQPLAESAEEFSLSEVVLTEDSEPEEIAVQYLKSSLHCDAGFAEKFSDCETESSDEEYEPRSKRQRKMQAGKGMSSSKTSNKNRLMKKKEQNKNAATRYREKRKQEEMERQELCEKLEKRNAFLRRDVADKEQEVKVLRQLFIDIFKK